MYRILKKATNKTIFGFKKHYSYIRNGIIISSVFVIFSLTGMKLGFAFLFNPDYPLIKKEILEINKTTGFTITFDGVGKTFFPGLIFFNTQIRMEEDHQHGPLFSVPEMVIKPDIINSIKSGKMVPGKILIKGAHWDLHVNHKDLRNLIEKNLNQVIKEYPGFHIQFEDNIFSMTFEKKKYERERWNITIKQGRIISEKGKITSYLVYHDAPWGHGEIQFTPDLCENCSLANGQIIADIQDLPANRLSWFFKDFKIVNGKIDIVTDIKIRFKKSRPEYTSASSIAIKNLLVTNTEDQQVIEGKKISVNLNLEKTAENIKSTYSGKINSSVFEGVIEKAENSELPEKFSLNLENEGDYIFPLYFGYSLRGLKRLYINMNENDNNNIYRDINAELNIKEGSLIDINKSVIVELPEVSIKVDKNSFTGIIKAIKGQSDPGIVFSGNFVPVARKILTHLEFDDYTKNKIIEKNSVNWIITESGHISGKNLVWSDFTGAYEIFKDIWAQKVSSDGFKGWRPSILREREWFQNYFMYSNFTNTVKIENWVHSKAKSAEEFGQGIEGNLNFLRSVFDLNLSSGDNKFSFVIDANSNYPIMRGEINYAFKKLDDFSMIWSPPKFSTSFSAYEISSVFATSGERFIDMANNYYKNSEYKFSEIYLNPEIESKKPNWETLEVKLRQYGKKVSANYSGKNPDSIISGWGTFNENEAELWKVKNSIREFGRANVN